MKKIAQQPVSSFNETVPNTQIGMQSGETQGMPQPAKNAVMDPNSDQYAAVPMEQDQQMPEQPGVAVPPEMVSAAQAFLGPDVMSAAMQGDPNAADLVARSAAHFGSTFMNMSNQGGMAPMDPNAGMDQSGMPMQPPMGITSPEEDIASELVPMMPTPQQAVPGQEGQPMQPGQNAGAQPSNENASGQDVAMEQPQQGQQQPGTTDTVDLETVRKLINLVKSGRV
jgi:hypothetical protein